MVTISQTLDITLIAIINQKQRGGNYLLLLLFQHFRQRVHLKKKQQFHLKKATNSPEWARKAPVAVSSGSLAGQSDSPAIRPFGRLVGVPGRSPGSLLVVHGPRPLLVVHGFGSLLVVLVHGPGPLLVVQAVLLERFVGFFRSLSARIEVCSWSDPFPACLERREYSL